MTRTVDLAKLCARKLAVCLIGVVVVIFLRYQTGCLADRALGVALIVASAALRVAVEGRERCMYTASGWTFGLALGLLSTAVNASWQEFSMAVLTIAGLIPLVLLIECCRPGTGADQQHQ